eukprot:Sdes_comp19786_c0_seq3m11864
MGNFILILSSSSSFFFIKFSPYPPKSHPPKLASAGGFAARKAITVVEHVEQVVAIEMMAACQALEFLRPLQTTAPLEAVHSLVRKHVAPYDKDKYLAPDMEKCHQLLVSGEIWRAVEPFLK